MTRPRVTNLVACTCKSIRQPTPRRRLHSTTASPTRDDDSRWPGWEPVIGLELHVQLKGHVKLLSSARAHYDESPNTHVAPFDAALPGSLPRLGAEPVRLALLACLALKSTINSASTFDRKHYFYPDLPAGFQVTQKYSPLAKGGQVRIRGERTIPGGGKSRPRSFTVGIDQIQLEQDTAKSSHDPETGTTLVDLNRAGAALVEIVTKPDMRSPEEAAAFVRQLQAILRHIDASDANMERGELRCDVNVSVQRTAPGSPRGTRCEVKNLNGVRFLQAAIESELSRQIAELEAGREVVQATRGFNAVTLETFHLRSKEDAPDYRYMPDPELGSVVVSEARLAQLRSTLPELPDEAFDRLQSQYSLSARDASVLVALGERLDDEEAHAGHDSASSASTSTAGLGVRYFEQVAQRRDAKIAANWVLHELLGQLSKSGHTLVTSPVSAHALGELIDAVSSGQMTGTVAKSLLRDYLSSSTSSSSDAVSLSTLITKHLAANPPLSSSIDLASFCTQVIDSHPKEVEKYRQGHEKVLMRLVGAVMKLSKGRADAKKVGDVLKDMLGAK